jgi:hypothetical protein
MSIFLGAIKQKNVSSIQKRVDEINDMIRYANEHNLEVVDKSQTWEAPMKFEPLKYSNGVLYVKYQKLDLYKYNRGKGTSWQKESYKVGRKDTSYGFEENESIRLTLTDIARMFRSVVNHYKKYGY